MKQLTFPAPRRNSVPTGAKTDCRKVWQLVKARKSEYNIFGLNLEPRDVVVEQRLWTSEPWTAQTALTAIQDGAWFDGSAEFESKSSKAFALAAQSVFEELAGEVQHG